MWRVIVGAYMALALTASCQAQEGLGGNGYAPRDVKIELLGKAREGALLPVVYVFDEDRNLPTVRAAIGILQWAELAPPVLLVGVSTDDRFADFTPTKPADGPDTSGGAKNVLGYIDDVLRPYLAENYPVSRFEVLHGHSLSGLFVLFAMLEEPEQFNGVIAIGASAWWDEESISKRAAESCENTSYRRLFLSLSSEVDSRNGVESIAASCARADQSLGATVLKEYPHEDHVTAVTPATHDGLRFVFDAWNMEPLIAARDIDGIESRLDFLREVAGGNPYISVSGFAQLARGYTREGDPETAIRILERADKLAPNEIMVLNFLGEAYEEAKRYEDACRTYRRSLAVAIERKHPMERWIRKRMAGLGSYMTCEAS